MLDRVTNNQSDLNLDGLEDFEYVLRNRLGTISGLSLEEYDLLLDLLETLPSDRRDLLLGILAKARTGMLGLHH